MNCSEFLCSSVTHYLSKSYSWFILACHWFFSKRWHCIYLPICCAVHLPIHCILYLSKHCIPANIMRCNPANTLYTCQYIMLSYSFSHLCQGPTFQRGKFSSCRKSHFGLLVHLYLSGMSGMCTAFKHSEFVPGLCDWLGHDLFGFLSNMPKKLLIDVDCWVDNAWAMIALASQLWRTSKRLYFFQVWWLQLKWMLS